MVSSTTTPSRSQARNTIAVLPCLWRRGRWMMAQGGRQTSLLVTDPAGPESCVNWVDWLGSDSIVEMASRNLLAGTRQYGQHVSRSGPWSCRSIDSCTLSKLVRWGSSSLRSVLRSILLSVHLPFIHSPFLSSPLSSSRLPPPLPRSFHDKGLAFVRFPCIFPSVPICPIRTALAQTGCFWPALVLCVSSPPPSVL